MLTGGRLELPAEVLLGHDVRRVLRPRLRKLDAALLERHAIAVADARVAQLPFEGVERMNAGRRELALDGEGLAGADAGLYGDLGSAFHRPAPLLAARKFSVVAA